MNVFLHATDVTLSVPLLDGAGNTVTVSSVSRRVIDESGVEVVTQAPVTGFVSGESSVTVFIDAASNTLAGNATRALRVVELACIVGGNVMLFKASYVITASDSLREGVNSFQNYAQAQFTALEVVNIPGWDDADDNTRTAALIEARRHIVQLSFTQLNSNVVWGQDSLSFVPEGAYLSGSTTNMFLFNGSLELITPSQFLLLPEKFKLALRLAQVAEADAILGGDPVDNKRQRGVVADFIGESKQVYRPGMALQLPVSRRALGYLSYFVSFGRRIGRT